MTVILFQGDSITDVGRNRNVPGENNASALGGGYPLLAASQMLRAHPDGGLKFFNRGVSGDKVPALQARWQTDTITLQPDVLSILVGVNDFWHKLTGGYTGTVADF
ncbi:MAG TPA: GDSL-type esterase/lipase family protein, partial [Gemmatimonadaceae bacterium]